MKKVILKFSVLLLRCYSITSNLKELDSKPGPLERNGDSPQPVRRSRTELKKGKKISIRQELERPGAYIIKLRGSVLVAVFE